MSPRKYLTLVGGGCGLVLLLTLPLRAEIPANPPDGVEVLGRGPVHEAYAQPVDAQAEPGPMVPREPPALIDEMPPDQKPEGDNVEWIPGYWQWDEDRTDFIWVSGFWRVPPPGRQWVAGHYRKRDDGWQWVSGYWAGADQTQESLLPPPPAPFDAAPPVPAPADDSVAVPGTWVYNETHYRWRPGYYIDNRPGWVWNPARYVWSPAGCVSVDGYWDYPLQDRGLLFAPVAIDRSVIEPNWCYTPNYVVAPDFLQGALFARPAWGHYYFGDYFGERYGRRGFTAWPDYGLGRGYRDPLYDYNRRAYGRDGWDRNLRGMYAGRANGDIPRPPHNLAQQGAFLRGERANGTRNAFRNVTPLAPLNHLDRSTTKLAAVGTGERKVLAQNAGQMRAAARQRQQAETRVVSTHAAPTRPGDPPHALKLDLPRGMQPKVVAKPPTAPLHEQRPIVASSGYRNVPSRANPNSAIARVPLHANAAPGRQVAAAPPKHEMPQVRPSRREMSSSPNHTTPTTPRQMARTQPSPPSRQATPSAPSPRHNSPPSLRGSPAPPPQHAAPAPQRQMAVPAPRRNPAPPQQHAAMPARPARQMAAPAPQRNPAPQRQTAAPARRTPPPQQHSAMPARQAAAPAPRRNPAPPQHAASPPRRSSPSPARRKH